MIDWLKQWFLRIAGVGVVAFLLTMGWIVYDGLQDSSGKADCAVVVGDPLGPDGKPAPEMRAALDRVALALKAGDLRAIVLAPGASVSGEAKAVMDGMNRYLGEQGVPRKLVLEDANGSTPETLGVELAGYLTLTHGVSVLLVAHYADITRLKLALHRAGVTQVLTVHTGAAQPGDAPGIAGTALFLWQNVFEQDVTPEAQKLVAQAKGAGQDLVASTTPAPSGSTPAAAPGSPDAVAPLSGGQTVNATGIGSFQVPRSWSQQIVYPILDPVWTSGGGGFPSLITVNKSNQAGSISEIMSEATSVFTAAQFSGVQTLSQGPFTTAAGLAGERMVVTMSKGSKTIDLVMYAFPGRGNAKVALLAGCLASDASANLPLFDSCAKTLQVW